MDNATWPTLSEIGYDPDPTSETTQRMIAAAKQVRYSTATSDGETFTFELLEFNHPERTVWIVPVNYGQRAVTVHPDHAEAEAEYRDGVQCMLDNSERGQGEIYVDAAEWGLPEDELDRITGLVARLNGPADDED